MLEKRFVYVIQSEQAAAPHYVGLTWNVMTRLAAHNAGEAAETRAHRPWRLVVAMAFATGERAQRFEQFLKSGAGAAFVRRYLLQ
jgi:predicted GIY-YIG superfamily endonuclease